jgi:hypothetical protein
MIQHVVGYDTTRNVSMYFCFLKEEESFGGRDTHIDSKGTESKPKSQIFKRKNQHHFGDHEGDSRPTQQRTDKNQTSQKTEEKERKGAVTLKDKRKDRRPRSGSRG